MEESVNKNVKVNQKEKQSLREYWKYNISAVLFGFGGSVWGGMTYYMGIPVAFLTFLNASKTQIGLITAIFWLGFALPGTWAAYASEGKTIKKKYIAGAFFLTSIPWLAYGIYVLLTGTANASFSIWLFLICYALACLTVNLYIPANYTLLFKIIPTAQLGFLLGVQFTFRYGGNFLSGFASKGIQRYFEAPYGFGVIFILACVFSILTALVILLLKEPEGTAVKSAPSFWDYLKKCVEIVKSDRLLVKFFVGKWLMSGHNIMMAFLLAYLIQERGFNRVDAGWFPALYGLGLAIGGLTVTKIADKYGPKYMMATAQIFAILYTLIAWFVPSSGPWVFFAAFIVTGLTQISDNVGYTNMCLMCCPTLDKSTYVAVTNMGIIPFMALLPIIFGKLMDLKILTFQGLFIVALCMMVTAILYLLFVLDNPKSFYDLKAAKNK
ncbi:MAG: MFS transporter [Candidatus Latescibacterota bacterium]